MKKDLEVSGGRQVGDSWTGRAWLTVLIPALLTVVGACGDDGPTEPPGSTRYDILVLNSTGQTLAPFFVDGDVILLLAAEFLRWVSSTRLASLWVQPSRSDLSGKSARHSPPLAGF